MSHFLTIHNNDIEKENRECSESELRSEDSVPTHEIENGHERLEEKGETETDGTQRRK